MARILNVVWGPFPDIRLEKVGRLLGEAGHQVDIMCTQARAADWRWGKVLTAQLRGDVLTRAIRRALTIVRRNPVEFPWRALAAFRDVLSTGDYDVVQWNDLPGVVEAAEIAHAYGARMSLDMHENFADNMWSSERDSGRPDFRFNMNAWLRYERAAVRAADALIVNIEEMGQRLVGMHGASIDKIHVVRNAEPPDLWSAIGRDPVLDARFAGRLVMLYVGGLSFHRGIDVAIEAMPIVRDAVPNILFVVVGGGNGAEQWRNRVRDLALDKYVAFEGVKPFRQAAAYYRSADFGIIPHHKYGQTDNGIPHKFAQNLLNGLPVVVSSCHALQRNVQEAGVGLVFRAGDSRDAAHQIIRMAEPGLRGDLARVAKDAAMSGPFSWDAMRHDLLAAYATLLT